ncbi:MAG TPA: discoidin domain-containing protein, partial [Mycobacterium sp.]|nr:discoidin domain-containing protein [Mycobacterium sp.]
MVKSGGISRRALVALPALAALGVSDVAAAASPPGDVVGKITVGYQGWFACIGDGAPINGWWHWAHNWGQPPSPGNNAIVSWPDMRDYARGYLTAFPNLGNGSAASLFSQYDQQSVDTHFRCMRDYGCDTAALQRFNPFGGEGPTRDAMAAKVRQAAEAFGRKFYIMYDVTNWTDMQSEIKTDWSTRMSAHTTSAAYARQNGKPVVCVWGFGFSDPGRPFSPVACLDVINWFKAQNCYVIGGVPTYWRTGINDSRPGFIDVYHAFNMLSPWMVGRTGDIAGLDWFYTNVNVPDQADCNARGIDYQPCVMPGDLSAHHRVHGDFMWRHFYNMVRVGAQGIYISMFDEYNEGNQIAKTAENASMVPTGSGFVTLDEDGTACTSDYYLRLTADGGRMLKGQIALTPTRPTVPWPGGNGQTNLARGRATAESSHSQVYVSGNAVDGNSASYWESANNAFPQWIQVDLGTALSVGRVVLKLPPTWGARTQTLSVTDGATGEVLVPSGARQFDPATGNTVTLTIPQTTRRYVRVTFIANTGWPAGQVSELEVYGAGGGDTQPPSVPGNLVATGRTPTSVSLAWQASSDNVAVTGYDMRQNGIIVATVIGTSGTIGGLNPATTYNFTVTARDAAGNVSAPSNTVSVTTDPAPGTNLARGKATAESSHTQVYVSGNAVDGNSASYWESANNAFP